MDITMCLEKVINDNLQALVGLIFLYISREVKVT